MAADLFETYAVTAIAVMLLGVLTFKQATPSCCTRSSLGASAILASIIGTFAVRTRTGTSSARFTRG